ADPFSGETYYQNINPDTGTEYLNFNEDGRGQEALFYMENALNYNRTFNDRHTVTGMMVNTIRNRLSLPVDGSSSLISSLAYRNVSLSGNFTYAYDNRYHAQFTFGYNGSE